MYIIPQLVKFESVRMYRPLLTLPRVSRIFICNSAGHNNKPRFFKNHHYRFLCTYNNISDRELQESFKGFWPKILTLQVLGSDAGWKKFLQLDGKSLLGPLPYSLYSFVILQDPLLLKYGFNPSDFAIGAEEAFKQFSLALSSTEFANFANGHIKSSKQAIFLQNAVSQNLYTACLNALRKDQLGSPEVTMKSIEVSAVHFLALETRVVRNNTENAESDLEISESDQTASRKIPESFPINSVVAEITMVLQATETYRTRFPSEVEKEAAHPDEGEHTDGCTVVHSRVNVTQCAFEGCISGHVPLDWKIISIQ